MKVRKQKDIPVANRIFTDREEPRAAFWKSYETYHQNMAEGESDIRVLNYYGIGGIGKSRLLKQLMTELDERISKPKYVYFDLNIHQESRAVLEALKNKLSSAYGFNFPLFELGVYNYAKKIGEDANAPEIKAYIEKSPFLSVLFSVAGKIPVASTAAEILSYADKGFAYARTYLLNHRKELVSIESKEATELYDYLPYLFAQDMTNNLEEAKKPMVLFLDTYERVVNEMASVGEPLNNDLWVRGEDGLVQNIPNVLWVIAGREKLKWERFDPEWNSALEQHILGNLGPVDSDSFLASAGVGGAKLRKQLYELTDGTPVYLDLCVDRFHDMTAKGIVPTIENFGDNLYSLIERFVRYMDDNKKDIVYVLACMQQWDDELITDIAGSVLANFSLSTYERVKDFSFIIESGDGLYNIHQTVGSVLLNNCPETIKLRTARKALEYYQKRLENKRVFEENYAEHLQQLIRFGLMVHTDTMKLEKFYQEQVSERLNELGKAGKVVHAEQMQEMLLEYTEENKESTFYAALIRDQAFFARCRGQYQESLDLAEKSVKLYQNLLGENHLETISALSAMAAGWYFLRQYENALEIDILVLQKRREFLGEEHPETLNALNAFAATLSSLDREEEALELHVQIHAKRKNLLGEDHPDTIISMNNMAISLDNLGQYEKALDLKTQVFEKRWNLLRETHLSTLSAMSSLATTLNNIGRYEEALDLLNQVYEKRREILGEDHENTIYAKNKLANTLFSLNRYEEASNLYHQVYEKRKEILGEDHIDTVDAMCNVARILSELNRYEEELQFEKLIFEKRKKLLGVNHKDTIDTMNNM